VNHFFAVHLTLTYRATQAAWESIGDPNRRFVRRCEADRHRFLRCLRDEIGEYLWLAGSRSVAPCISTF